MTISELRIYFYKIQQISNQDLFCVPMKMWLDIFIEKCRNIECIIAY